MFTLILFFAAMIANGKTVETIEFVDIDGRESRSYLFIPDGCTAETPCPGWQVNPDWTGLDEYELTRACMIADWGYVAYVPDVYGIDVDSYDHIGTPVYEHLHRVEPGPYNGLLHHVAVDRTSYMQKIRNGYEFLSSRPEVISDKLVTNGYCFGGVAVMDALHQDVPFLAGFGNHPNIFTFDTGVQEGNAPDGRVVSLSGALDFADTYNFDPALTTGNTNGAISWWNSLERESARWQQVRYSGIGHFFTNFDYAVDPNPDHPEDVNHYDATADLRSWGLQKFHAMTMFGEITQEPMESSGDACSDPIYHCGAIQIPHGAEGSTMRGMEYYPTACNAESLCSAVIVIPDEDSHDFTMAKNEQIVREGYITISADVKRYQKICPGITTAHANDPSGEGHCHFWKHTPPEMIKDSWGNSGQSGMAIVAVVRSPLSHISSCIKRPYQTASCIKGADWLNDRASTCTIEWQNGKREIKQHKFYGASDIWNSYTSGYHRLRAEGKRIKIVEYENLVLNTESVVRDVASFLGLPIDGFVDVAAPAHSRKGHNGKDVALEHLKKLTYIHAPPWEDAKNVTAVCRNLDLSTMKEHTIHFPQKDPRTYAADCADQVLR